ncbi:MAG TPA: cell division protein FtsA, partial [Deltaproteobacteria bacterium]|nr:cell division protein FtsA [Deltaproteobacteria bacterium]
MLVGLDIGTTKIACIVGERNGLGGIDVVGIGTHPSSGLSKG